MPEPPADDRPNPPLSARLDPSGGPGPDPRIDRRSAPIWTPPTGPPQTDRIPQAVYEAMGEDNIIAFTRAFYRRLGSSAIAHMFPRGEANLMRAADKSAAMNVFLFGGPHLYQQRHGPPRLRMRHLPFEIDESARLEWMRCFRETLQEASASFGMPAEHIPAVALFFDGFSRWMVNTAR